MPQPEKRDGPKQHRHRAARPQLVAGGGEGLLWCGLVGVMVEDFFGAVRACVRACMHI